jgi:hypothetical protein
VPTSDLEEPLEGSYSSAIDSEGHLIVTSSAGAAAVIGTKAFEPDVDPGGVGAAGGDSDVALLSVAP